MRETLEVVISKPAVHCGLVFRLELQFRLCRQQHGAAVDKGLCGLVLNVACGVAPLGQDLSVVDVHA